MCNLSKAGAKVGIIFESAKFIGRIFSKEALFTWIFPLAEPSDSTFGIMVRTQSSRPAALAESPPRYGG